MGIQITEDKLSEKAKEELKNCKSKSQYLRDAIEYYVQYKHVDVEVILKEVEVLKRDLKEGQEQIISLLKNSSVIPEKPEEISAQEKERIKNLENAIDNGIKDY
jgi:predicted DNA-binding protein